MSATNRGRERIKSDFYATPSWLTRAILPFLGKPKCILEPACGQGAIVRELEVAFPEAEIIQGDIMLGQDFLADPRSYPHIDLIITNPPYSLAKEFIERALLYEPSFVAMLLRLNFLGSQSRAAWHRAHPAAVFVTPKRPSFAFGGTDATEYAWFVWGLPPTITILNTENITDEFVLGKTTW